MEKCMVVGEMPWLLKAEARKYTRLSRWDLAEEAEEDIFNWLRFIRESGNLMEEKF